MSPEDPPKLDPAYEEELDRIHQVRQRLWEEAGQDSATHLRRCEEAAAELRRRYSKPDEDFVATKDSDKGSSR